MAAMLRDGTGAVFRAPQGRISGEELDTLLERGQEFQKKVTDTVEEAAGDFTSSLLGKLNADGSLEMEDSASLYSSKKGGDTQEDLSKVVEIAAQFVSDAPEAESKRERRKRITLMDNIRGNIRLRSEKALSSFRAGMCSEHHLYPEAVYTLQKKIILSLTKLVEAHKASLGAGTGVPPMPE
ncbi:hypothetical protein KIPB_014381, partial [Kipferlia bialata]|eukprot:g14381.t1